MDFLPGGRWQRYPLWAFFWLMVTGISFSAAALAQQGDPVGGQLTFSVPNLPGGPSQADSPGGADAPDALPDASGQAPGIANNQAEEEVMKDIHDLKPLETFVHIPYWKYLVPIGATLLLLAIGVLLLFLFKKYRKSKEAVEAIVAPDVEALALLDALSLPEGGSGRRFYYSLSAVMRGYMERRFGFEAMEMTSEELLVRIRSLDLPGALDACVREFVGASDPVKFAGASADGARMRDHHEFVKRFIEDTREGPVRPDA